LCRDPAGIDDVVAVRRPPPRLEYGREVEVTDAELAQIGNERARLCEAEVRRQLQPVGAQHQSRRKTQSERDSSVTSSRALRRSSGSRSNVESSSTQREPNRRGGRVKTTSSCCALKRIRNES